MSIPFGELSILFKIVAPVVVMPDMLSKKESVIDKFNPEKKNGKDPNVAMPVSYTHLTLPTIRSV